MNQQTMPLPEGSKALNYPPMPETGWAELSARQDSIKSGRGVLHFSIVLQLRKRLF